MGLKKQIELENGVIVNYHRITSINKITNNKTLIEISSYTNQEKRQEEVEKIQQGQIIGEAFPMNVFINTIYLNKEYVENENIKEIYDYLKTTEMFKNAENA